MTNKPIATLHLDGMTYGIFEARKGYTVKYSFASEAKIPDLTETDFMGLDAYPDLKSAKEQLAVLEKDSLQRKAFGRQEMASSRKTPWGISQGMTVYDIGIEKHSTASHGGFKLDRAMNRLVDASWRNDGGWYEEDNEWAKVAYTFPHLFTELEQKRADQMLRDYYPDEYEELSGVTLSPGESFLKDEREFQRQHENDFVVISAISMDNGTVLCTATRGGVRQMYNGPEIDEVNFIVPLEEYKNRSRHGFVIDPSRHEEFHQETPTP